MIQLSDLRRLVNEQRMYVWMLVFIVAFIALTSCSEMISPREKALEEARDLKLRQVVKDAEQRLRAKLPSGQEELTRMIEGGNPLIIAFMVFTLLGTLGILVGLILTIIFISFVVSKRKIIRPITGPVEARWGILDVCKVTILIFFFGYVINLLEMMAFWAGVLPKGFPKNLTMVFHITFPDLLCLGFVGYFVVIRYGQRLRALGLTLKSYLKSILFGLVGYVTILPTLCLILFLISIVAAKIGYEPPPHPLVSVFLQEERRGLILYTVFFAAVLGPVVEEIFFRGFAYSAIKKRVGVRWAIVTSAAFFALAHMNIFSFLPVMLLGISMAYLYEKTGSLLPPITLHIIHNSILISIVLLIRGM